MKKQYVSIIILIVLVALYLLVEHRESLMVSPKSVENFLDVDTTEVSKITMSRLGSSMTLSRVGSDWYLMDREEPRRVDGTAMKQLMDIVGGMKVGNVISDNPSNQIKFQVDTLTGSTVSVYSGDNLIAAVVVGKMADFMHTYVRLRGENDVYLAEGMMSHLFNRPPSDWLDKTVFDIAPAEVQSVEFQFGEEHYRVMRADTVWQISKTPFSETVDADQGKVEQLVSSLCALKAGSFATDYDTTEYDFSEIGYSASIAMVDGSSRLLEGAAAADDANRHFVRIPEDTAVFVIFDATWKNIAKSFHDLLYDEKNS
jgi:hypothetical protein